MIGNSDEAKGYRRALVRAAATLGRRASSRNPSQHNKCVPSLWFVTDPARTPDPIATARSLPRGAAVIYRAFGAPEAEQVAQALRRATARAGLVLLIGADAGLAYRVGADGVHLPERLTPLCRRLRKAHPRWLITAAAHSHAAIRRAQGLGLDAILVSAVFPSRSASAHRVLGPVRFEALAHGATIPVIALGGLNGRTARRLLGSSAAGLAAVEAFNL